MQGPSSNSWRRRLRFLTPSLLLPVALGACAGQAKRPTIAIAWPKSSTSASGYQWFYTPRKSAGIRGQLKLPGGQSLYYGQRGERWLTGSGGGAPPEPAANLANETLVGATRSPSGNYVFIGAQATTYESESPLGPFIHKRKPPRAIRQAAVGGGVILAVAKQEKLIRSTNLGVSYEQVDLPSPAAASIAMSPTGYGAVVAFPEAVYETKDNGETWKKLPLPPFGATGAFSHSDGRIFVYGMSEAYELSEGAAPKRIRKLPKQASAAWKTKLESAPEASNRARDRLTFTDSGVVELIRPESKKDNWKLARTPFGARRETTEIAGTSHCRKLSFSQGTTNRYLLCIKKPLETGEGTVEVLHFYRWDQKPNALPGELDSGGKKLILAAGKDGTLLLAGACPTQVNERCNPHQLLRLTQKAAKAFQRKYPGEHPTTKKGWDDQKRRKESPWKPVASPAMAGRPFRMTFTPKGKSLFVLDRSTKSGNFALFVSKDGGNRFREHSLEDHLTSYEARRFRRQRRPEWTELSATEEGEASVALATRYRTYYFVVDEFGQAVSGRVYSDNISRFKLSAYGRKAIQVRSGKIRESLDGGQTWHPMGVSQALQCRSSRRYCTAPIAAGPSGSLVGSILARRGWGKNELIKPDTSLANWKQQRGPVEAPAPIECQLSPKEWQVIPHRAGLPSVGDFQRGTTTWASDVATRGKQAYVVMSKGDKVVAAELFKKPSGHEHGWRVVNQLEGAAALRFKFRSPTAKKPGKKVTDIQIAWLNLFRSTKVQRASVKEGGAFSRRLVRYPVNGDVASFANRASLSVAREGIFARWRDGAYRHYTAKGDQSLGTRPPVSYRDLKGKRLRGKGHMSVGKGKLLSVLLLSDKSGAQVGEFGSRKKATKIRFASASREGGLANEATFSYGQGATWLIHTRMRRKQPIYMTAYPLAADRSVLDKSRQLVTLRKALESAHGCSKQEMQQGFRYIARAEKGSFRPVVLKSADGTAIASMVTGGAVLYATQKGGVCIAGIVAEPLPDPQFRSIGHNERLWLNFSNRSDSWYFRKLGHGAEGQARTMRCKPNPKQRVPYMTQLAADRANRTGVLTNPELTNKRRLRFP